MMHSFFWFILPIVVRFLKFNLWVYFYFIFCFHKHCLSFAHDDSKSQKDLKVQKDLILQKIEPSKSNETKMQNEPNKSSVQKKRPLIIAENSIDKIENSAKPFKSGLNSNQTKLNIQSNSALTIKSYYQQIKDASALTLEAALSLLPPQMKSVLLFKSRSVQGASRTHPRVILYLPKFYLTFNGDPSQSHYDQIEMIEQTRNQNQYQFASIEFGAKGPLLSYPTTCAKCHGDVGIPIWDLTPLWPGALGERYLNLLSIDENEILNKFKLLQPTHLRYQWIQNAKDLFDPSAFLADAHAVYSGQTQHGPNEQLTESLLLGLMDFHLAQISKLPNFLEFVPLLLASLLQCAIETWAGNDSKYFQSFGTYRQDDQITASQKLKMKRLLPSNANAIKSPFNASRVQYANEALDAFRFVSEKGLGYHPERWSLVFEKNSIDFSFHTSIKPILAKKLTQWVESLGSESLELFGSKPICKQLQAKSAKAIKLIQLNLNKETQVAKSPLNPDQIIEQCAGCHQHGLGPDFRFKDPNWLKAFLKVPYSNFKSGLQAIEHFMIESTDSKMPPDTILTSQEIADFLERLQLEIKKN